MAYFSICKLAEYFITKLMLNLGTVREWKLFIRMAINGFAEYFF